MIATGALANTTRNVAILSAGLMGLTFYGALFGLSLYLQQAFRYSPAHAGVALLPLTAASLLAPLTFYRPLSARVGHRQMLRGGFLAVVVGAAVLIAVHGRTAYIVALIGMLLIGTASTTVFLAVTSMSMSRARADETGLVSGLQNTLRQSGALIAVALIGAVLGNRPAQHASAAFAVLAGCALIGLAIAGFAESDSKAPDDPHRTSLAWTLQLGALRRPVEDSRASTTRFESPGGRTPLMTTQVQIGKYRPQRDLLEAVRNDPGQRV